MTPPTLGVHGSWYAKHAQIQQQQSMADTLVSSAHGPVLKSSCTQKISLQEAHGMRWPIPGLEKLPDTKWHLKTDSYNFPQISKQTSMHTCSYFSYVMIKLLVVCVCVFYFRTLCWVRKYFLRTMFPELWCFFVKSDIKALSASGGVLLFEVMWGRILRVLSSSSR